MLAVAMVAALASCGVEVRDVAGPPPTTVAAPSPGSSTTTEPGNGGTGRSTTTTEPDGGGVGRSTTTTTEPERGGGALVEVGPGDRELNNDEEEEGVLIALEEHCLDGDDRACDVLFLISPGGSDYEDVGDDCGGREPAGVFCAEETTFVERVDDPRLKVLADDCTGGDMVACDLLYEIAPADSDLEALGVRCGDESGQPIAPSCLVALG